MMILASLGSEFGFDTLIIFFIILLVFGAKNLPNLAKGMGEAINQFSQAKDDLEEDLRFNKDKEVFGSQRRQPSEARWLVPLALITALSICGVLTREQVFGLLLAALLIWVGIQIGRST